MKIKKYFRAFWKYCTNPSYRFLINAGFGVYNKMSDEEYLHRFFRAKLGRELDLENPKTLNEKLQWLKLHDRRPEQTMMADKYLVRDYIKDVLGEEYLIPLLGVWDNPDDIPFDQLPNQFVLKCNHNSGTGMCICRDKGTLDIRRVKKNLRKGLKENYFLWGREWPYLNINRKIIAEQYISDSCKDELSDYKFYCFNGFVDCVMICLDRQIGEVKYYFFDENWNLLRYNPRGVQAPDGFTIPKPKNIDLMFSIARKLSEGLPFARIDLYNVDGRVYFGEITFFSDSGFDTDILPETDAHFGNLLNLDLVK